MNYVEGVVEFHGFLHGVDEVLLALGVQRRDVVPGRVELFDVLLDFGFIRLSAQIDEFLTRLAHLLHFGFGVIDVGFDLVQDDLLLLDLARLHSRKLLTDQRILQVLQSGHDALQLFPEPDKQRRDMDENVVIDGLDFVSEFFKKSLTLPFSYIMAS